MEHVVDRSEYRRINYKEDYNVKKKYIYRILKKIIIESILGVIVLLIVGTIRILNIDAANNWIENELSKNISVSEIYDIGQNKIKSLFNTKFYTVYQKESLSIEPSISCISTDISTEPVYETAVEGVNQLSEDAKIIKENYKFAYPLIAPVTSWFGVRESTNPIVTNYHSGIDLAAETGTPIKAALSGTVILASSSGAYGKHIMIENDNLIMIYAHCSKLNVKKGQNVKQGDKIGEVGSTGQSTGPHLHFEIRYEGRLVNPADILSFRE